MNGKEYCSVNERKKRDANNLTNEFSKSFKKFTVAVNGLAKSMYNITGNRTDQKIVMKAFKKHIIPFVQLVDSWNRGQQKNPHLSESVNEAKANIYGIEFRKSPKDRKFKKASLTMSSSQGLKGHRNMTMAILKKAEKLKKQSKWTEYRITVNNQPYIAGLGSKRFTKYAKPHINDSVHESVEPQGNMAKIAKVVKDKQATKLSGVMIDMQSASLLMKLYDKVSDKDKEKMNKLNAKMLTTVIKRLWSRVNLKLPV